MKWLICSHFFDNPIASQSCACHNGWAIVSCTYTLCIITWNWPMPKLCLSGIYSSETDPYHKWFILPLEIHSVHAWFIYVCSNHFLSMFVLFCVYFFPSLYHPMTIWKQCLKIMSLCFQWVYTLSKKNIAYDANTWTLYVHSLTYVMYMFLNTQMRFITENISYKALPYFKALSIPFWILWHHLPFMWNSAGWH